MKRILISFFLLINMYVTTFSFMTGIITETTSSINNFSTGPVFVNFNIQHPYYAEQILNYTSGGVFVNYEGIFTNQPIVLVSVLLNANSVPGAAYTAVIATNSPANATIAVYQIPPITGIPVPAGNQEVDLLVFAFEFNEFIPIP